MHPSCSLTLEWNSLGPWEDAFATFCGALAANSTLRQLDLRNNQISHKGAEELALALRSNASLQQLGEAAWLRALVLRPGWAVLVGARASSLAPQPWLLPLVCPRAEGVGNEGPRHRQCCPAKEVSQAAPAPSPTLCDPRFLSRPALESHRPPGGPGPGELSPQQQNPVEAGAGWEQHPQRRPQSRGYGWLALRSRAQRWPL